MKEEEGEEKRELRDGKKDQGKRWGGKHGRIKRGLGEWRKIIVGRDDIITRHYSPSCRFKVHGSNGHNCASSHAHTYIRIYDYQTINQQTPMLI